MLFKAEVLAHSVGPEGDEVITMRATFPRIILAEFNTHKKISKNTASSRAIPIKRMIKHVRENMFVPTYWGAHQPGMQAATELKGWRLKTSRFLWKFAGNTACNLASLMNKIGLHKQLTNRLIENFSFVTVVFTTTDLMNFIALRDHNDAQPEIHRIAGMIRKAYLESVPTQLKHGEWHLPLVNAAEKSERTLEEQIVLSVARCASTSYITVDGHQIDFDTAMKIYAKLSKSTPIHASPFEHQVTPDRVATIEYRIVGTRNKLIVASVWANPHMHGNTLGFIQYRKTIPGESVTKDNPRHLVVDLSKK